MSKAKRRWIESLGGKPLYQDGDNTVYQMPPAMDEAMVTMVVREGERVYETRSYRLLPLGWDADEAHLMKIMAKTRGDGLVWWVMKLENAQGRMYNQAYGDQTGWQSVEAFRAAVAQCEQIVGLVGLLDAPVVVTGAEYEAKARAAKRKARE
jgi:hypothetical protein